MKILILTYQGDLAGSTHSISYLAKGMAERGHEVYMGLRKESWLWGILEGTKVHRVPMTFKGKFDTENWKQIADIVKDKGIQLINAQSSKDRYTSIFAKWRYGLKVKVIHTRRQMPASSPVQSLLYNLGTDGIVAVSGPVKEALVKLGIRRKKVKVILNGTPTSKYENIDKEKVEALRKKFDIQTNEFILGCVSRYKEQLQIFQALEQLDFPVKAIFCGMEENEEVREVMNRFKQPHTVFFEGNVHYTEVLNYYPLFTIKVLASTTEGLSQSLLEAMALGIPVVATAFAGNLDLVKDDENGLLFDSGDIAVLAGAITRLKNDTDLRKRLSEAGKKTALVDFNIDRVIENYEAYFSGMVAVSQ